MRAAIAIVALIGLFAAQAAAQGGGITIGQIPAAPIPTVSWPTATPLFSSWIPIYTTWADTTRIPSSVTITIDFTTTTSGSMLFITSANPTAAGASPVTLTLSGTSLLNTNTPAGYFAFALVNTDPSLTTPPAPVIRVTASPQPDWPAAVGNYSVQVLKRPVKISIAGNTNTGFTDIATPPPAAVSLVPGLLSQPITIEFLLPLQQPISSVSVQIDPNGNNCGFTTTGTTIGCGNFYNFLSWNPDSDTPPASGALNTQASWSNVPTGTRKLTFQMATHPSVLTSFPPFVQSVVFQNQNGRYANLAYFPSTNGTGPAASYFLPNLRLTLSGGDAGQYNIANATPGYNFNPVSNINQVPVFLENVNAPQMLTGMTKTFTYHLAHPLPGQSVTYNLQAPPGVTVNPTSISFNCPSLSGGAGACPTTASVAVTIDNNLINDAYSLVQINALQPSGSVNAAFPRTIPAIQINVVDRFTDNELIVDSLPPAVAAGQTFTFSVRTRVAPQPGNTLNVRFISQEFAFDQSVYALSASNTGFMVTATALSSPLFKRINYPAAQDPSATYTVGGEIISVFGFITAVFSGPGARNFLKSGIWDATNSNFGVIISSTGSAENIPTGGIEIYRPQFQYRQATLLNGGGNYVITTWDQPSAQITVGLKNAPPTGGISLTPIINCAFVTANPPTLAFGPGVNEASFTLTANRDGAVATAANQFAANPCTVNFAMSGESALNYIQPPSFTINVPTTPYAFNAVIEGGLTNTNGNPRTFQIGVTPNFLPRSGNTVTLQPFWALGTFTPASQTWTSSETSFTKTFVVTENDFIDPSLFMGTSIAKLGQISWSVTGPDAGYYTVNNLAGPVHSPRTIVLPAAPAAITVGSMTMVKITLSDAPTAGTLIVTPVPNVPGALTFLPASYTFTAGSPTTALFQVTGNNIGSWYVEWELTGTDQYLYTSGAAASQFTTFSVGPRGAVSVPLTPPPAGFFSGFWYGPYDARVAGYSTAPLTGGSLTITPTSDDWKFQPSTLTFKANGVSTPFLMRYMPAAPLKASIDSTGNFDFNTVIEYNLGGTDAWQYAIPSKQVLTVKHRNVVFSDETGASPPALSGPAGVPVLMWVTLPEGPVPTTGMTVQISSDNLLFAQVLGAAGVNGSTGSSVLDIQFSGDIVRQQVLVWTNFNGAWGHARQGFPDSQNAKFSIFTTITGVDAVHYNDPANMLQVFTLVKKLFYFDTSSLAASWQNVLNSDSAVPQIPLGQVSQIVSVGTTGLVTSPVTLTPVCGHIPTEPFSGATYTGCPYIQFTPSEITFAPGQQAATFTFTPRAIAPRGVPVIISWSVTGADAPAWDIQISGTNALGTNIPNELTVRPVPALKFSPMPAIYIDGKAENLVVTLTAPTDLFPPFQLQIRPSVLGVVVQPDILQFAPGQLTQTFSILHVRPAAIAPLAHFYTLAYSIKYAGSFTPVALLPRVVPTDVTEVRIVRYAIIPEFPTVLGLDWLKARINLTRAPFADVALVPHLPNFGSGQINVGSNPNSPVLFYPNDNQVGVKAPGGRVIFDPPAVTFLAGQVVSEFKVRADRLSDNEALYLRVDWEPVFHAEDVNCYYPFAYTWHIAAASTATLAWALVAALAALLLL